VTPGNRSSAGYTTDSLALFCSVLFILDVRFLQFSCPGKFRRPSYVTLLVAYVHTFSDWDHGEIRSNQNPNRNQTLKRCPDSVVVQIADCEVFPEY
jgi:hypothetical protein